MSKSERETVFDDFRDLPERFRKHFDTIEEAISFIDGKETDEGTFFIADELVPALNALAREIRALASTPPKPAAEDVVSNLIAARKKGVGMTCSGSENNRQVYRYELHFQNIKDMHEFSAAMNNLLRTDKEPS